MDYEELVRKAKDKGRIPYGYGKVNYKPCEIWRKGNQINLWTYWQGYQLEDIAKHGVDILLVGQDWGNPDRNPAIIESIERIQANEQGAIYNSHVNATDRTLTEMFTVFGDDVDVTKRNPGLRLFFTNYSLGYREGSETGGMTKKLMKQDKELFDDLVSVIKPKIIICLGKLTYEMVSGTVAHDFIKRLRGGEPFVSELPEDRKIKVYGVAHCGARGVYNVGGKENMKKTWEQIANDFQSKIL